MLNVYNKVAIWKKTLRQILSEYLSTLSFIYKFMTRKSRMTITNILGWTPLGLVSYTTFNKNITCYASKDRINTKKTKRKKQWNTQIDNKKYTLKYD